jgi:hypothetical protein
MKVLLVRMIGVEPTCLAALDPKSSASANFATSAWAAKVGDFIKTKKLLLKKYFQKIGKALPGNSFSIIITTLTFYNLPAFHHFP